jgi:hypothetical protein
MAVPTGSGTEVLKAHSFDTVDSVRGSLTQGLIIGVQHHTYTVISTLAYCIALNATSDYGYLSLTGNGNHIAGTGTNMIIARFNPQVGQTFVFNDRFSFFGAEPTAYTEPMDSAAEQLSIAAQGQNTVQTYGFDVTHAGDDFHVHVTFLDQDWT